MNIQKIFEKISKEIDIKLVAEVKTNPPLDLLPLDGEYIQYVALKLSNDSGTLGYDAQISSGGWKGADILGDRIYGYCNKNKKDIFEMTGKEFEETLENIENVSGTFMCDACRETCPLKAVYNYTK